MDKRIKYIDFFRGLAIISMVIYHTLYDLKYIFYLDMEFFSTEKWYFYQQYICISFIFLSGISTNYSKKLLKNAFKLLFLSIIITLITVKISSDLAIYFGILHFLSFSMFSIYFYKKFEKHTLKKLYCENKIIYFKFMFFLNLVLFLCFKFEVFQRLKVYQEINSVFMELPFSYIIGFPSNEFYSSDYFPIIPWIFLSFCGYFFGKLTEDNKFDLRINENNFIIKLGNHSLLIYMFHQVIVYVVLYILFKILAYGNIL